MLFFRLLTLCVCRAAVAAAASLIMCLAKTRLCHPSSSSSSSSVFFFKGACSVALFLVLSQSSGIDYESLKSTENSFIPSLDETDGPEFRREFQLNNIPHPCSPIIPLPPQHHPSKHLIRPFLPPPPSATLCLHQSRLKALSLLHHAF